jgi:hypothetical protein
MFFQSGWFINAQEQKVISCHFRDAGFEEFCMKISQMSGLKIYYDKEWTDEIRVNLDSDSLDVFSAVRQALKGSGLELSVWNNDLVILPGTRLLSDLPSYEQIIETESTIDNRESQLTESEQRYINGRKPGTAESITIGKSGTSVDISSCVVLGRVIDAETGEPLTFVPIYVNETKKGTITDLNGFFTLTLPAGRYNAQIEYVGYKGKKMLLEILSKGNFTVRLSKDAIKLKEVVVSVEHEANMRQKEPGLDQISIMTVRKVPSMMGDRDVIKVSVTLPGIISIGEGNAGLNVRGSGSDQNAFYINKIPVYNTSHLFGFFSAFNSDLIKDFSIYKGHIPAQYGGRLASVFDIRARQGNRKNFSVRGGLSPVSGNIVLEGPFKQDTGSFIFSARSSYSDWILSRLKDTVINSSNAGFRDLSGGINWDFRKTRLSLFAYHSNDKFSLSDISDYRYSNNGASMILNHSFSPSLRGELAFIRSEYSFSTMDRLEKSAAYSHSYKLNHYEIQLSFKQILNEKNSLEYGGNTVLYRLDRGTVSPYGENSMLSKFTLGNESGIENSLFISDSYDFKPWINISMGLRYTLFTPTGPASILRYNTGGPKDINNISDTLVVRSNTPFQWYHEPDARIAVNIETDRDGSVKFAFNRMHQNLFMLNTTNTIAPNTQWKLADYHLLPSSSNQVSLGIFRSFPRNGLEASLEVYYKRTYNYPEFRDGTDFLENPNVETSVLQGDQKAYGLEFYVKRSNRRLEGWLSYTLSRSLIRVDSDYPWNRINNGEIYPANYDIPHALNMVLNYYITRRFIASSVFTYQTGKPVTYPESMYYMTGIPFLDYSKRNAYRIPDYFRTDISLTIEGNLKKNKLLHSSLILNLYNATGRKNPFSVFYKTENGKISSYKYSVIGVPIFTVTWLFKLGNYASQ